MIMALGTLPDLRRETDAPSLFAGVYLGSCKICWNLVGGGGLVGVLESRVLVAFDPGLIVSSSM